jgi:hypothetical protein
MTTPTPECPACRMRMERGFVYDVGRDGRILSTRWAEGVPEKSLLRGLNVKGRRQLDTVTFRCPRCGWLIWFAPDAASDD